MQPPSRKEAPTSHSPDRPVRLRFDMSLPVLLRTIGHRWKAGVTKNVSVNGAFVLTDRPLLLILVIVFGLALSVPSAAQTGATSAPPTAHEKAQALEQEQQRENAQKSQEKAQRNAEKSQKKAQKDAQKSQKKAQKQWNQQHPSVH